MSQQNIRLRLLSLLVIAYMLLAFAWWSILLWTNNRDALNAKVELQRMAMVTEQMSAQKNSGLSEKAIIDQAVKQYYESEQYLSLSSYYERREYMIVGEAVFFVISLAIGVWLINGGYNKEVMAAKQRRNFLLSITHELKSPLASIRLILETFQKRKLTSEQAEKLTRNGLTETERLTSLVNDLLLSAKLETVFEPHLEPMDLAGLVRDILQKLRDKYPKVAFSIREDNHLPAIEADKLGLTSVILNLLENAVKYTFEEPKIDVVLDRKEGQVSLSVADNGIGISEKDKKQIFEKFFRVGNEDTRRTKGTGLGLFIVKEIVKSHEGTIAVLDNQPKGTIFSLKLPIRKSGIETSRAKAAAF